MNSKPYKGLESRKKSKVGLRNNKEGEFKLRENNNRRGEYNKKWPRQPYNNR